MSDVNGERCFSLKNAYRSVKCVFAMKSLSKTQSMEWNHTNSPVKKVSGATLSKEGHAVTMFGNMKGPITVGFLEKWATVKCFLLPTPNASKSKISNLSWEWPKAPFSIATTPRCRGECYTSHWIAPLYPWYVPFIILSVKQGGIKYHFLSLWYDST